MLDGAPRPDARDLRQAVRAGLDDLEGRPRRKAATMRLAMAGPMPRICPEARYFSMPSAPVGGVALSTSALN